VLFSPVIYEHFSKNRMIISVVAAKYGISKNVRFLLAHPVLLRHDNSVFPHQIFSWHLSELFHDISLTTVVTGGI